MDFDAVGIGGTMPTCGQQQFVSIGAAVDKHHPRATAGGFDLAASF